MPANELETDPYSGYRFRIRWDGRIVAGFSDSSGLARPRVLLDDYPADDPSAPRVSQPAERVYEPITLERGVTHDAPFEKWANMIWDDARAASEARGAGWNGPRKDFRRNLDIEVYDEAGQLASIYHVYRSCVSQYIAMPKVDPGSRKVAIQSLTLQNKGWERDTGTSEPDEPA
jgi:phage tail-like protein